MEHNYLFLKFLSFFIEPSFKEILHNEEYVKMAIEVPDIENFHPTFTNLFIILALSKLIGIRQKYFL